MRTIWLELTALAAREGKLTAESCESGASDSSCRPAPRVLPEKLQRELCIEGLAKAKTGRSASITCVADQAEAAELNVVVGLA